MKRKLLLVGRTRYDLPLSPSLARKFDALSAELDVRVLATASGRRSGDPRFRLARQIRPRFLDGAVFYALLPLRVAREVRDYRPDVVLAQGGQETTLALIGRALGRVPTRVVADIHGDTAAPTRLYGSRLRKALAPLGYVLFTRHLRHNPKDPSWLDRDRFMSAEEAKAWGLVDQVYDVREGGKAA